MQPLYKEKELNWIDKDVYKKTDGDSFQWANKYLKIKWTQMNGKADTYY